MARPTHATLMRGNWTTWLVSHVASSLFVSNLTILPNRSSSYKNDLKSLRFRKSKKKEKTYPVYLFWQRAIWKSREWQSERSRQEPGLFQIAVLKINRQFCEISHTPQPPLGFLVSLVLENSDTYVYMESISPTAIFIFHGVISAS